MRVSITGVTLDTLAVHPIGAESVLGVLRDRGGTFGPQPFTDGVLATVEADGSGLVILERGASQEDGAADFRITRVDMGGDTVLSRAYPYRPTRLPREAVDSAIEAQAASLHSFVGERTGTTLAQWKGWVGEAMYAPPFYPPVNDLVAGRDGTIWLGLNPPRSGTREWLVVSPEGESLARVSMPDGTRVLAADRHNVWGVETDKLDVPYIVRYEVVRP